MKCLLVFDHLNDIIYTKYNKKFALHINNFAKIQGLLTEEKEPSNTRISANIIVQIFSPIVTSQRIMSCQFGNSYTSVECSDGLNIAFEEFMGYLFVCIGKEDITAMKRFLRVCVTIVRYICGPDVLQLKNNTAIVTSLIDSWIILHSTEQTLFVEAVEQLMVNSDLSSATLLALRESVDKLTNLTNCSKIHALVMVQNKFLALYSSQQANILSSTDILFTTILCESYNNKIPCHHELDSESDSEEEFYSPSSSPLQSLNIAKAPDILHAMHKNQVLLAGADFTPKCIPHAVYIYPVTEGVNLIYLLEVGNAAVSSSIYETFLHMHAIQAIQVQRDIETLKPAFENLDIAIKKLSESLKKIKDSSVETSYKKLMKKWEFMRKKYLEFIKNFSDSALLSVETSTINFLENLRELLNLTAFDKTSIQSCEKHITDAASIVSDKLANFNEFLKVKAIRNFSLGSDSLTINKYLEEFPGLVHFLYIDRTTHRVTAPTLDFSSEETNNLTKQKIWAMINFSRNHLQEGHLSIMWKDTTFNYSYFLWFEDITGSPMKPTVFPINASKALPQPGIFCGDFYQKLKEVCFPKISHTKIRCYELYCIHLGLATAACVLEHTRRLAATIWELRGHPHHPMDLL